MGQLRVQGITDTFLINIYKSNISNELKESIYEAQNMQNQINTATSNNNSSADEILKFKQLLDQGIITNQEFEKKKEDLLK
ncbi:MAG: SHOCT domain-containing protein [Clostridia bacterium]|nr:SHOCT domain-containing protein [Clostridia bacterium]